MTTGGLPSEFWTKLTSISSGGTTDEGVGRFGDCWWALTLTQVYFTELAEQLAPHLLLVCNGEPRCATNYTVQLK